MPNYPVKPGSLGRAPKGKSLDELAKAAGVPKTMPTPARRDTAKAAPKPPAGRVGNYAAPVDTAGMSAAEKETFGFGKPKPPGPSIGQRVRSIIGTFKKRSPSHVGGD